MSEQTIYNALRAGGLSAAGACAVMGNMYCESGMRSDIVETRCSMSGAEYTRAVDTGTISKYHFIGDAYGYGLCQWTYSTRKAGLYDLAKSKGISISNEEMQCQYCIQELTSGEYADLFRFLCNCTDEELHTATGLVCTEYERPAVNNVNPRYEAAKRFYNQFATDTDVGCTDDACPISFTDEVDELCDVSVRIVRKGDLGRDVYVLQCGLQDMGFDCGLPDGDFGCNTEEAIRELQRANGLDPSGVADAAVWLAVLRGVIL